jgi:NADH-quinone oxidoreductase subunit N
MNEAVTALAPVVIVALWGLLTPLAGRALAHGSAGWPRALALLGLGLALAAALTLLGAPGLGLGHELLGGALVADRLALAVDLAVIVALLAIVASDAPRPGGAGRHGLSLLVGVGAMLCAHAGDLTVLVAGLELACLATAALLWLGREPGEQGARAGWTWLIGQALAAGLWWMGLALVYGATGTTRLGELGGRVSAVFLRWGASTVQAAVDLLQSSSPLIPGLEAQARDAAVTGAAPAMLLVPGIALALAGLLARLGAAPLHLGLPAIVQRAGASGAAAVLVLVRLAAAAVLLRLFVTVLHAPRLVYAPYGWGTAVAVLGGLGALLGAVAAARQAELRRLLAWATVANTGLVLLGLVAAADFYAHAGARSRGVRISDHVDWGQSAGDLAVAAVLLTLAVHALASLGLLAAQSAFDRGRGLVDLAGLGRRAPLSAVAVALCLLGLAGAPPTGAFIARLMLLQAGLEDSNLLVRAALAAGVLGGAALAWACLRVLALLWSEPAGEPASGRGWARVVLAVLAAMVLGTGLFGHASVEAARAAAAGAGLSPGSPARRIWLDTSARE